MAVVKPRGTAIKTAPNVTSRDPTMSGQMLNISSVGYQRPLNRCRNGISRKAGIPSRRRNQKIKPTIKILEMPAARISVSINISSQLRRIHWPTVRRRTDCSSTCCLTCCFAICVRFIALLLLLDGHKAEVGYNFLPLRTANPGEVLFDDAAGLSSRIHVEITTERISAIHCRFHCGGYIG